MAVVSAHRPAVEWLNDLQKAKEEGLSGVKPKTTIQDLLERINDPNAPEYALIPTSPRSVEACFRLGIDPIELQFHPIDYYQRAGEDHDIAQIRYERNEHVRQERVRSLIDTRKMLIDDNWAPGDIRGVPKKKFGEEEEANAMVEKEKQRLEVLKRRQEKEIQQMVQYEVTRKELLDKQQRKLDELERRAQDLARQKAENEVAWIERQRDVELQKVREEQELIHEAKRIAEEKYRRDKELQARQEEEDRRRKKEAFAREMERRRKTEDARRETEAILAAQAEEVRLRKLEMDKRDQERLQRMDLEAKEKAALNQLKRKKAEQRIQSALSANEQAMLRKRQEFEAREAANEMRRKELEEIRKRDEERKRMEDLRKERERQDKYQAAVESEEMRKMTIKQRAEEKERLLAELYARRKKENDIRKVEQEFEMKLRLDKVDSLQKNNLYMRQQNLERIMYEYEKTRTLLRERSELQMQRKMSNMRASIQRQSIQSAIEHLKGTKDISKLASSGTLNISELLNKSRPATAM